MTPAGCGRPYWAPLRSSISVRPRWNRAMAILSSEPEPLPFRLNRNGALDFFSDAFSAREPAATSLENALTIGELTALLCAIILTLIPLTIWAFCNLESRKRGGWIRREQKPVRAKF